MIDTSQRKMITTEKVEQAEFLIKKNNDRRKAKKLYMEVFETNKIGGVENTDDLIYLAASVAKEDLLNDRKWARKILEIAFKTGERSMDFYAVSQAVKEILGDESWAKRIEAEGDGWRDAEDDALSW